jgi:hypothetical protein
VWLDKNAVDQIEINGFLLGPDRFQETAQTEVSGSAEDPVGGPDDEGDRFFCKGIVTQPGPVDLRKDEFFHLIGIETFHDDRVGNSGFDILIDLQSQGMKELGLTGENEVMIFRKIFKKESNSS